MDDEAAVHSLKTARWPRSLHGGQVVILMAVISILGYGGMSFASLLLFDATARANGSKPPIEVWLWFVGAVALVAVAHGLGYAWQKGRKLNVLASLCLALWLPAVVALWSGRSIPGALKAQTEWNERNPVSSGPNYREQMDRKMAYDSVFMEYGEIFLLSGAAGLVSLYFWFGGRRKKPEVTP